MNLYRILSVLLLFVIIADASWSQRDRQYKRASRLIFDVMDEGKVDQAIDEFIQFAEAWPGDHEALYGLSACYSLKGDVDRSMDYMKQAVDAGMPFSRFLAGPRTWFAALHASEAFQAFAHDHGKVHDDILVHGPMVGSVDHQSARFWVRTKDEAGAVVNVSDSPDMQTNLKVKWGGTLAENDYTAILTIDGLEPDTRYYYQVYFNGIQPTPVYSFKTFPEPGASSRFSVAFGGGAGYTPQYEYMWNTIGDHDPLAFLFMGDNVYIDNPDSPGVQRYCYYRRQSRPEFREFVANRSIFAVWDDHDFVDNDMGGGPEIDEPAWKIPVWKLYKENWNNPAYGGGEEQPGCWMSFSIGDVDFIMLDSRYYRNEPGKPSSSMLGAAQKQWLFDTLKQCEGTFKVIASPVPWSYGSKPGSLDPWQGYKEEREEIFSFIESNRIEGVVLISADRHRSDAWRIERPNGYDLYEFESSRLTNIHTHGIMEGSLFGYNDKCSFGKLTFDTSADDPTVAYEIISIDDERIHKMTLKHSQLDY